jgi:hypothetical protein
MGSSVVPIQHMFCQNLSNEVDVSYEHTVPAKCGSKSRISCIQHQLSNEVIFEGAFAGNNEKKK